MTQMKAVRTWAISFLNLALLWSAATVVPLFAQESSHAEHAVPAKLVRDVRNATQQFLDVNNAGPAGYGPAFGCVSGPDHGAMGIHYVNGTLVGDGQIKLETPEALIYEPVGNARRLVGVEYIVDAATWLAANNNVRPHLMARISSSSVLRTGSAWIRSLSCTSGPGATIRKVHLWIGTTR